MTQSNKLLLFDGSSLAFRAFYGLHDLDRFKNKEGLHTNALYAFHLMLTHLLEVEKPTHALVAWDAGKTTFRTKMYKDYKEAGPLRLLNLRNKCLSLTDY